MNPSTPSPIGFSVVVNTIDRARPLDTLLRSLEHQSHPHFEVIAVVGPTRDDTLSMLESWRDASKRPASLRAAAASLGMGYSSFREKVAARKGMGPHQYLLHMSIDEASRLLIGTDESIKAIAYATGFRSVESFCRAFRKMRGMTASRYRTIHRVKTKR